MIPVKGRANLYRDPSSGAIINRDNGAAHAAREAASKRKLNEQRITKLEDDIDDIKSMLKLLLENR
jgi:predicted RNA methylase